MSTFVFFPRTIYCHFKFNQKSYLSGETVEGTIHLKTYMSREIKGMRYIFLGISRLNWVDTMTRYPKIYTAEEMHMHIQSVIHSAGELLCGEYTFRFSLPLPQEVPTSCVAVYGHTGYELILHIEYLKGPPVTFKQEVMVLCPYNIMEFPALLDPISLQGVWKMGFWPFRFGPIIIALTVERGAYVPGMDLNYTIIVQNKSRRRQYRAYFTVHFLMVNKFTALLPRRKTRYKSYVLGHFEMPVCIHSGTEETTEQTFTVPRTLPTTRHSHIITNNYEVRLEIAKNQTDRSYADIAVPIVIGTPSNLQGGHDILQQQAKDMTKSQMKLSEFPLKPALATPRNYIMKLERFSQKPPMVLIQDTAPTEESSSEEENPASEPSVQIKQTNLSASELDSDSENDRIKRQNKQRVEMLHQQQQEQQQANTSPPTQSATGATEPSSWISTFIRNFFS